MLTEVLISHQAKDRKLVRPRKPVDRSRIAALRRVGRSWAAIGQELGVGEGTVRRAVYRRA